MNRTSKIKLVSACLVGINCNHRRGNSLDERLAEEHTAGCMFPICPEMLGGLPMPRTPAEIKHGNGSDVLDGKARVITQNGDDVTEELVKGAYETLRIAKEICADEAILKANSPSCGSCKIYDGTFSKRPMAGDGVTAALLKRNGIRVRTEKDI